MSMYGDETRHPVLDTGDEGGAKQSFKDEVDVNNILALYAKTGLLTPVTERSPAFVDVSTIGDYRTALENVRLAGDLFDDLPSAIRAEFEHDPAEFLDFCTDPANEDRMRDMGLLPPLVEAAVVPPVAPVAPVELAVELPVAPVVPPVEPEGDPPGA